jgi:DNA-directed RNA polymerase subunit F
MLQVAYSKRLCLRHPKQGEHMTQNEIKALVEDLRLNHEFCPKEIILQAADELERMQQGIETIYNMYTMASNQRDELMDQQRAQIAAMRGRIQ